MATRHDPQRVVFLVYGRDVTIRHSVVGYLEELGLRVLSWEDAIALTGRPAPHARDVLDAAVQHVGAMVVLFTGDDEARLRSTLCRADEVDVEGTLAPQPRANVLFEAGLAFARFPEKTVVLQVGRLRPLSDLAGIQYVLLDESDASRANLANRLKIAGCKINDSRPDVGQHGLPASSTGLPGLAPGGHEVSMTVVRYSHTWLFGPRFGGALSLVDKVKAGTAVLLSVRLPPDLEQYQILHWQPGSLTPLSVATSSGPREAVFQCPIKLAGPIGVHIFDLRTRRSPSLQYDVVARARCTVEAP